MFLIYFLKMAFMVFFSVEVGMELMAAIAGYSCSLSSVVVCVALLAALLVDDLLMKSELKYCET